MTVTAAAAAIAAVFSTILTALWSQSHWSARAKRITSTVFDVILGTAVLIATNQIGVDVPEEWSAFLAKWIVSIGIVAFGAQALYLKFKGLLSKLEDATTLTPANTDAAADTGTVVAYEPPADTSPDDVTEDTWHPPSDDTQEG